MYILVIEDNPDLVANLYDFLEAREHVVDAAYNGTSGLDFANRNSYDAIVLDLMLPNMNGLDVCRSLRESGNRVPILLLTARDTLEDKLKGFSCGADDYLVKPFALQELEARLLSLVRRAQGETVHQRLTISDLTFDPDTLHVERAGQSITLPPIPLKILSILIQQSPRVVPRHEIERHIWGDDCPDSDALRAHMHVLRTAIDKPFATHLLHTVHSIGYQLVESDAVQD